MPFRRAADAESARLRRCSEGSPQAAVGIKSLVNAQLDNLRAILFLPTFYTAWERLLVGSGLSTSVLFPALVGSFAVTAVASTGSLVSALLAEARGEDVNLLLPAASALIAIPSLIVIFYGLALAPKPQTAAAPRESLSEGRP